MSNIVTDPAELWQLLGLDQSLLPKAYLAAKQFPLKVTHSYLQRIKRGHLHDPLLKQVLPIDLELNTHDDYVSDPLAEKEANPIPGLLHKYHGRVLVTLTSACAIHCRYCFRRHFPYADNTPGRPGWDNILAYIASDNSIEEVILSGGDPLSVSDQLLNQFSQRLKLIPHVKTLRLHTRLPIVLPSRVTALLCEWIKSLPFSVVIVLHCNHAQEINDEVLQAITRLQNAGAHLLNQSVLLREINDDVETLVQLSSALFSAGVMPYYLHTLDKVAGAMHFDIPQSKATALHSGMMKRLPGYLVPRLVREEPGADSKTLL